MNIKFSLLIMNVLIFISAFIAIYFSYSGNINYVYIFKSLTTILVFLLALVFGNKKGKGYYYILIGFVFCLLGDIFLVENHFIQGLLSFFISHILFTISFILISGKIRKYIKSLVLILLFGGILFIAIKNNLGSLKIPVILYISVISFMCWQGVNLYILKKTVLQHRMIALASILFVISDSVIAINKFTTPFVLSDFVILTTYWLSITLLANATVQYKKETPLV